MRAVGLVLRYPIAPSDQLEADHEQTPGTEVVGHRRNHGPLGPWLEEDHHVAGRDHDIELPSLPCVVPKIEPGEIRLVPLDVGTLLCRPFEHGPVEIHPDAGDAPTAELDGHPARATPGVQDRRRSVARDQARFTVDVVARGGEPLEPFVVGGAPWDVRS